MEGLILNLPQSVYGDDRLPPTVVDVSDVMGRLTKISQDIQCYHWPSDEWNKYYTVRIKDFWELKEKVLHALPGYLSDYVRRENLLQEMTMCYRPDCFEKTADQGIAMNGTLLFDKYGEQPHLIHECCRRHCGPIATYLAKSLDVVNLTPDRRLWTKIASWQVKTRFYAQKIEMDEEGDHEMGYSKYSMGSPFYGPASSREEAVNLASEHQF